VLCGRRVFQPAKAQGGASSAQSAPPPPRPAAPVYTRHQWTPSSLTQWAPQLVFWLARCAAWPVVKKKEKKGPYQLLAESKKQQREAPFKAPQMDAPGQHPGLAEGLATNPADAHSIQRNLACINRAPLQALPRQLQGALQQLPHRVLLRATPSKTCSTKIPWSAQAASTAIRMESIIRRGPPPPPPSLGGGALRFSCALAVHKPPPLQKRA
jgi:hypothetical protein